MGDDVAKEVIGNDLELTQEKVTELVDSLEPQELILLLKECLSKGEQDSVIEAINDFTETNELSQDDFSWGMSEKLDPEDLVE